MYQEQGNKTNDFLIKIDQRFSSEGIKIEQNTQCER